MANEEELNISGPDATKEETVDTGLSPGTPDPGVNKMATHVANLSGIVGPGDGAEELVDKILQTDPAQLIPWEECTLPSLGLYYDWPDGIVRVKAMGQVAEKILATQRLAQSGQSIDYLFRECCQFPEGFDPTNLLLGDRIFLLYYLRGITHGNMYEFAVTCPNESCESVNTHRYDLNDLAETITWAKKSMGGEPFKVNLPYMSKATGRDIWVGVRFLRAADANDMLAKRKAMKKMSGVRPGGARNRIAARRQREMDQQSQQQRTQMLDDTISDNMEKIVVSIMGITDQFKVRDFVSRLHSQDTATIREWLRENTPGIDNTIEVDCPDCGNNFVIELPITESFFRPAKPAGV
jgi:hypothetical protein